MRIKAHKCVLKNRVIEHKTYECNLIRIFNHNPSFKVERVSHRMLPLLVFFSRNLEAGVVSSSKVTDIYFSFPKDVPSKS